MPARKILLIIADQLRADCVDGALENHVNLPNIAALRREAVTFRRHFSVTSPCGPARASLLTGLYAMNHRSVRNGTPLSASHTNLALELRKSGFEPLLFGYTDTSQDPRTVPLNDPRLRSYEEVLPGFREVVEMRFEESFPWRAELRRNGYHLPDYSRVFVPVSPDPARPARPDDPAFYRAEDSDTAFLTNVFLREMAVRTEKNWCAALTYIRPHPPWVAPAPYNHMYHGAELPEPACRPGVDTEEALHPFFAANRRRPPIESLVRGCDGQLDEARVSDVQMLRALYLGLATELDAHIGRVIAFLKETGQYDDTLIVFTADHGEMLGDHHMWGKQQVFDPAYHVPLIIRDPAHPERHGTSVAALSESTDVTPTILDLAGRRVPPAMDGRSLGGFLAGAPPQDWKDCIQMELDFGEPSTPTPIQIAENIPLDSANLAILREARFKLIHFNGGLPPLLYDLQSDPHEFDNLAADPAHQATLLRMTQKLLSHRMSHADRGLSEMEVTPNGVLNYQPD